MEETLELVEVVLAMVETRVEEEAVVVKAIAEVVMEEVMVDIMDLEVMVATMAVVLVKGGYGGPGYENQGGRYGDSEGYDGYNEGGNF
jgi:hypothetical protein